MATEPSSDKGAFQGRCNRGVCLTPGATFYNQSTRKYYCEACAVLLNRCNPEAMELFGTRLCISVSDPAHPHTSRPASSVEPSKGTLEAIPRAEKWPEGRCVHGSWVCEPCIAERVIAARASLSSASVPSDTPSDDEHGSTADDFFVAFGRAAEAKDLAANGPNEPLSRRSLHAVTLTMAEILAVLRTLGGSNAPR